MLAVLRSQLLFGLLVAAQAAHSVEEYVGRLWENFPPARFLTGLVSADREFGFLLLNIALVALGVFCYLWPVRRRWPSATAVMWGWAILELINGVGHPLWALLQQQYTPGVATAPILLVLAILLTRELLRQSAPLRATPA